MTKLEKRIQKLEKRIRELEARRVYVPYPVYPQPQFEPEYPSMPGWIPPPTIICGTPGLPASTSVVKWDPSIEYFRR